MTDYDDNDNDYNDYKRLIMVFLQNLRLYSLGTGNSSYENPGTVRKTFFPRQTNTDRLIAVWFEQTGGARPLSQYR
jgi:hypothetical protein